LTAHLEICCGWVIAPTLGPTRTAADFRGHVQQTGATDPGAGWVVLVDNRNTSQSESWVVWVAQAWGVPGDRGVKGQQGVLKSQASRAAFLSEPSHRLRFVYPPKHTSWLNQVEIWFSMLVRKLLQRSSFASVKERKARVLAFIDSFNRTMAKPIRWLSSAVPQSRVGMVKDFCRRVIVASVGSDEVGKGVSLQTTQPLVSQVFGPQQSSPGIIRLEGG
jgi:hypothetical protein